MIFKTVHYVLQFLPIHTLRFFWTLVIQLGGAFQIQKYCIYSSNSKLLQPSQHEPLQTEQVPSNLSQEMQAKDICTIQKIQINPLTLKQVGIPRHQQILEC